MFGFNLDKRMLYIMLGILILFSIGSFTQDKIASLLLVLPGVIIAITFHEFAHAYVADKLGDTTPRNQGRLNLNPASHIDPIGFVLLIFAHFGWGRPVEINPRNFNRNISMEAGQALVSAAGPLMNFILAIIFTIIYFLIFQFADFTQIAWYILQTVIQGTIVVNIGLGVFNLIPLPPLDGSKIFIKFMPFNAKRWLQENESILYFIFLALWITGMAGTVISPIIGIISNGIFSLVGGVFSLFI